VALIFHIIGRPLAVVILQKVLLRPTRRRVRLPHSGAPTEINVSLPPGCANSFGENSCYNRREAFCVTDWKGHPPLVFPGGQRALNRSKLFLQKRWRAAIVAVGFAAVAFAASAFWQASQSLHNARLQAAAESEIPLSVIHLDRPLPDGIDTISSPAVFNDAVEFQGNLYLAGPGGLDVFGQTSREIARYRTGLELPPYSLTRLATGFLADSSQPELFVATRGAGLLSFNGRRFDQILPASAAYRNVTAVLPLSNRRLLLGTAKNGLLIYDGKQLRVFQKKLADFRVTALAGKATDFWIGTMKRGVLHWHAGQVDHFSEAEGLPDPQVLSLASSGNTVYVGTPMGVAQFLDGRFNRVLAKGYIARSLFVHGKSIEVGTVDEGTLQIPLQADPSSSSRPEVRNLNSEVLRFLDVNSRLMALARNGLYQLDQDAGGWERVAGQGGSLLTDSDISALAFDSSGRLWIGYFDRGLDVLLPNGSRVKHIEDEHVFCVNRIVCYRENSQTLVATANGLALFDSAGRERQVLGREEGLISNHVTDVVLEKDGMTVATPAGITMIDASGSRSLYAFQGLVSNHVYALAASGGRLLAGTLGGLSILQNGQVLANFTTANSGLKRNWITAIAAVGSDWFVGTYGAGVLRLDSTVHWQTFDTATGPFEVNPNAVLHDGNFVYAGTHGRGLLVYDHASERWNWVTDGLPSMNVTAIAVHGKSVFVGTDDGLVRISKESLASR
jgi:ligand-binding sensor domain-containing protein